MKRKFGIVLVVLGVLLMSGALGLFVHNRNIQLQAGASVDTLMPQLMNAIHQRREETPAPASVSDTAVQVVPEAYKSQMPEVEINGNSYIGFVSVPKLELELPVMADWSYPQLQEAPCRFSGDLYTEDLVVMAHNYARHFGTLKDLREGDAVTFTDMDGITAFYQVVAVDILESTAVEDMIAGEYDLTLFTCTYGGKSRVTVRCDRI